MREYEPRRAKPFQSVAMIARRTYICSEPMAERHLALMQGRPCVSLFRMRTTSSPSVEISMAWFVLFAAGLFEVGWAVGLKYTDGFTRLWPSLATIASMIISLGLLGIALRSLPLGTAYAIWTGVGTIGTVILGVMLFGESAAIIRLACIGLIVAGIVGLKLVTP